jgi:hypothetical protein
MAQVLSPRNPNNKNHLFKTSEARNNEDFYFDTSFQFLQFNASVRHFIAVVLQKNMPFIPKAKIFPVFVFTDGNEVFKFC